MQLNVSGCHGGIVTWANLRKLCKEFRTLTEKLTCKRPWHVAGYYNSGFRLLQLASLLWDDMLPLAFRHPITHWKFNMVHSQPLFITRRLILPPETTVTSANHLARAETWTNSLFVPHLVVHRKLNGTEIPTEVSCYIELWKNSGFFEVPSVGPDPLGDFWSKFGSESAPVKRRIFRLPITIYIISTTQLKICQLNLPTLLWSINKYAEKYSLPILFPVGGFKNPFHWKPMSSVKQSAYLSYILAYQLDINCLEPKQEFRGVFLQTFSTTKTIPTFNFEPKTQVTLAEVVQLQHVEVLVEPAREGAMWSTSARRLS